MKKTFGQENPANIIDPQNHECDGSNTFYFKTYEQKFSGYPYQWTVSGGTIVAGQGYRAIDVLPHGCENGYMLYVQMHNENECGIAEDHTYFFLESNGRYYYTYSPNPADSYLDVARTDIKANQNANPVEIQKQLDREKYYEIILYNKDQKPEFRQKTSNRQVRINTSRLEPGIYFLHIIVNDEIIMKEQIVIN